MEAIALTMLLPLFKLLHRGPMSKTSHRHRFSLPFSLANNLSLPSTILAISGVIYDSHIVRAVKVEGKVGKSRSESSRRSLGWDLILSDSGPKFNCKYVTKSGPLTVAANKGRRLSMLPEAHLLPQNQLHLAGTVRRPFYCKQCGITLAVH